MMMTLCIEYKAQLAAVVQTSGKPHITDKRQSNLGLMDTERQQLLLT
jgi:hypothetical protein